MQGLKVLEFGARGGLRVYGFQGLGDLGFKGFRL